MKLKKIILLSMSLVIILISMTVALKSKANNPAIRAEKTITRGYVYYFVYTGTYPVLNFGQYTNPNNYTYLASQNPYLLCRGGQKLCAVLTERQWDGFDWRPDFSNTAYGSAYSDLYAYYMYGIRGSSLFFKN